MLFDSLWQGKPPMLAEALRAAIQAGTSIDTTAAAMYAASRTPAAQPNRKHDPVPRLKPSSRAAVGSSERSGF